MPSLLASLLFALVPVSPAVGIDRPCSLYEATVDLGRDPVDSIRQHLREVECSLRAVDVSHLGPALQATRERNLDRLADYRERGLFPRNESFPELVPHFIDAHGTACAVAHLMIESGAGAIARRVSRDENYSYVPDLQTPGVVEWVRSSGLTLEECAMIQPAYSPPCPAVSGFMCASEGSDVLLTWEDGLYYGYTIFRDGVLLAFTDAGVTEYVDEDVAPGDHSYVLWGECLGGSFPAECTVSHGTPTEPEIMRGECNGDGNVDIADAIRILGVLFVPATPEPGCEDACDANDDGLLDISDAITLLSALFDFGVLPEPGGPCGVDETDDLLDCVWVSIPYFHVFIRLTQLSTTPHDSLSRR